jgi:hypothetical protein
MAKKKDAMTIPIFNAQFFWPWFLVDIDNRLTNVDWGEILKNNPRPCVTEWLGGVLW